MAELIARQGQNPKLGTIFAGPYITHLVRGMNFLDSVRSMERIGSSRPLWLATFLAIGIVEHYGQEFIPTRYPENDPEECEEEDHDEGVWYSGSDPKPRMIEPCQ